MVNEKVTLDKMLYYYSEVSILLKLLILKRQVLYGNGGSGADVLTSFAEFL